MCWGWWRWVVSASLLGRVACYTHYAAGSFNPPISFRHFAWSLPADSADETGLGGGIAYAIEEGFCDRLIHRFREQSQSTFAKVINLGVTFVDCDEIKDAIARAFSTWAANHKLISFKDVSAVCASGGGSASTCPIAEIAIDALEPEEGQEGLAAFVRNRATRSSGFPSVPPGRRTTSGIEVSEDWTIGFSTMTFVTTQCWYLDNTFCSGLHQTGEIGDALVRVGLLFVFILGWAFLGHGIFVVVRRVLSEDEPGSAAEAAQGDAPKKSATLGVLCRRTGLSILDQMEKVSGIYATLILLLLFSPPVVYVRIYLPCFECYDFEAATAHEIGHILGFHHPDKDPALNMMASAGPMSAELCERPLSQLEAVANQTYTTDSIMFSTTTVRARACLTDDDLDGLNYLYPS